MSFSICRLTQETNKGEITFFARIHRKSDDSTDRRETNSCSSIDAKPDRTRKKNPLSEGDEAMEAFSLFLRVRVGVFLTWKENAQKQNNIGAALTKESMDST